MDIFESAKYVGQHEVIALSISIRHHSTIYETCGNINWLHGKAMLRSERSSLSGNSTQQTLIEGKILFLLYDSLRNLLYIVGHIENHFVNSNKM